MTAGAEPQPERRPRLNPFAFPSDTTFRFVLLVVAVLGATLYIWEWIYFQFLVDNGWFLRKAAECLAIAPNVSADLDAIRSDSGYSECTTELVRPSAWWTIAGALLVVLIAVLLTIARPWWQERSRRLRPLTEEDAPAVVAEVRALSAEAGLREAPRLVWNPLDATATGLAYGHPGRHSVALTGGLVVRQATDPEAFRAVVRHELAHIRNHDVALTYLTVSFWHAFVLGALVPFAATLADESWATIGRLTWRVLALAALIYLTRNAVLRSREVYADVRASIGETAAAGIRRVLAALPPARTRPWARLLRVHPDPAVRLATVNDTRPLFRLEIVAAFGAGVAATIAFENVSTLVAGFVSDPFDVKLLGALAFAPAVIGVVGLGIWRSAFATLAEGQRTKPVWLLSLALAAGFLLGPELALQTSLFLAEDDPILETALDGRGFLWLLGLVVLLTLLLEWLRACSSAWIRALAGRRSRGSLAAGLVVAAGVLTIVMGIYYATHEFRTTIGIAKAATTAQHAAVDQVTWAMPEWAYQLVMNPQLLWTVHRDELFPALVAIIALPLAAGIARRRPTDETSWAFLDPGGRLQLPPIEFHPLRPLLVGLVAGGVFLVTELVLRFGLHNGVEAATRARDEFLLGFFAWQVALAVVIQACAGVIATAVSRHRTRVLDGLAAALIAGSIAAFGLLGGPTAGGCVDAVSINPGPCTWDIPAYFAWNTYRQVVLLGAAGALAASLLTLGVLAIRNRASRAAAAPARAAASS
jgi:Zn-dependent protease with chaperone function